MSLDKTILARAREDLAAENRRRSDVRENRRQKLLAEIPGLAETDAGMKALMAETIRVTLTGGDDVEEQIAAIAEKSLQLQDRRAGLLRGAGYPENSLDDVPACPICSDTGFVHNAPCECLMKFYRREQAKELSSLEHLKNESFDTFQLFWYGDKAEENGKSARAHMQVVYEFCRTYAENFGKNSGSLLFSGGPGLGKTFLSACIARTVSEQGFSVMYQRAGEVFSAFEEARFSRGERQEAAEALVRRFMHCDLLILDDLGTEMTNALTVAGLYELVNSRLAAEKRTIISTNLPASELSGRYSPQVASRIIGEYEILRFVGEDIRLQKKRMR